ncbi:MAG: CBS domain-containing protein [Phenylobacterium sp.]
MLVSQILRAKGDAVFTVAPTDTVGRVAEHLHSRRIGALVVTKGGAVVGIVSERDIVRAVAGGDEKVTSQPVSAYMTADVLFAAPGETLDSLLARMTDRRIRHLPVVQDGRLVGIVSIGDLVKWKISEVEAEADGLKAYIAGS